MSITAEKSLGTEAAAPEVALAPVRIERTGLRSYLFMPVVLALVLLGLYLYISSQELDTIEERSLNREFLLDKTWEHIQLTVVSTVLVILIAVPLGVLLTRDFAGALRPFFLGIANIGQAVPTIGVLALLAVGFNFLFFKAAIVGLVAYTVLPVLRNTMVGLQQVDENVLEAGRGMGISKMGVLTRIELPLAVPIILAGVRTALVINVGAATLAAYIAAGGLGSVLVAGLSTNRITVQITGAVLTLVLALFIDYLAGIAEDVLRPKGL